MAPISKAKHVIKYVSLALFAQKIFSPDLTSRFSGKIHAAPTANNSLIEKGNRAPLRKPALYTLRYSAGKRGEYVREHMRSHEKNAWRAG